MRPIKFRGRDTESGEFVYAELGEVSAEIRPDCLTVINDDGIFTVDPESIAQLVGYDTNGREVYEGDTLIAADDIEWTAELVHAPVSADGFQHILALENFTLKDEQP